ncbi:hypothetical protein [Asanoa iriomotensis]|uniref:UTRA domain-containing protein n=1 Tax=Asanoa iriomotensis TaxID=234613 RepID=A0ABQ4C499_9ACTN|nr:hypothetical protein [Asanoa iriomotensis]GIF57618.1 hypothetical protein Air01nite_37130 [Asanoa iriomotensis]
MPGPVRHDPYGDRLGLERGRLRPYAEVVDEQHPTMQAFRAGKVERQPGRLLRDYLAESGGAYEFNMPIGERLKQQIIELATLNDDAELKATATKSHYVVSLEHLRGLDPNKTRIVVGLSLDYTHEEATALGKNQHVPEGDRVYIVPK